MKILIMGLSGSGKTYFARQMQIALACAWYNADEIRTLALDWDFTIEGRIRQANRMYNIAEFEKSCGRTVICDFICPTQETRKMFDADITIWMNTVEKSQYEDTNKIFEVPTREEKQQNFYEITGFLSDQQIRELATGITLGKKDV